MFVPGSIEYHQFIKEIDSTLELIKGQISCKEITDVLEIVLKSYPRWIYQLQQEFEADNPCSDKDITKLVNWSIKKGYFPHSNELRNKIPQVTDLVWATCVGLASLENISNKIEQQCKTSNIDLSKVLLNVMQQFKNKSLLENDDEI